MIGKESFGGTTTAQTRLPEPNSRQKHVVLDNKCLHPRSGTGSAARDLEVCRDGYSVAYRRDLRGDRQWNGCVLLGQRSIWQDVRLVVSQ